MQDCYPHPPSLRNCCRCDCDAIREALIKVIIIIIIKALIMFCLGSEIFDLTMAIVDVLMRTISVVKFPQLILLILSYRHGKVMDSKKPSYNLTRKYLGCKKILQGPGAGPGSTTERWQQNFKARLTDGTGSEMIVWACGGAPGRSS